LTNVYHILTYVAYVRNIEIYVNLFSRLHKLPRTLEILQRQILRALEDIKFVIVDEQKTLGSNPQQGVSYISVLLSKLVMHCHWGKIMHL
jgi:hypothetical protein